ncbi:MAG: DUF5916 domain-containing protein [Candidatus Aminicenantes bacterium]
MKQRRCLPAVLFLAALFLAPTLAAEDAEFFEPLRTDSPPVIDGRLDDEVWRAAPSVRGFKTFIPDFDREPGEKTVAYMAYDAENLYFAFKCFDREPDKIKAAVAARDTIRADDFICINLDTFNDRQSLYAFYVNPLGIQTDSRFAGGKEDFSVDVVWTSAGRLDPDGYTVELRVPFKSIRYAGKRRVEMSIFFERRIARISEHSSFPALDPARGYFFLTQMMPLELIDIKKYTLLEALPAFTYGQDYGHTEGALRREKALRDLSLTGKYGLTSQLILDATWNPDYSQIEADAGQVDVNLRYDLFFPEKRPFFLEGSEMFNQAGASGSNPLLAVVHTRTIIDPLIGFKLSGKVGKRDTLASLFALDESPSSDPLYEPGDDRYAGFGVLRYKRAVGTDGYLGAFYTGRGHAGGANHVAGADGLLRLNKSSVVGVHGFGSWTKAEGAESTAGGAALAADYLYDTRDLGLELGVYHVSTGFRTDVGYLTRQGVTGLFGSLTPKFYPKSRFFRKLQPNLSLALLKDLPSGLFETDDALGLTVLLPGNTTAQFLGRYSTEVFLGRRFDTSGGLFQVLSHVTKQLYVRGLYFRGNSIRYAGDPYQGYGNRFQGSVTYKPSERFDLTGSLTFSDFFRESTKEKEFDYAIWRGRLTYQMNKYLFFRGVVEYNTYRRTMLTDLLASFTYIPGTVVQLGYGSLYDKVEWAGGEYRPSERFLEVRRGLFFKASYLWRL